MIPVLHEEQTLASCLDSLIELEYPDEKVEILLALADITSESGKIAQRYAKQHPNIKVLNNITGNTAVGRNACIKAASGEYLMDYSGHVTCDKNLLKVLALKLQELPVDVCAVGCSNLSPDNQGFIGEASGVAFLSFMGGGSMFSQNAVYPDERYVDHMSFSCYRKSSVDEVGGFDPVFGVGQDYELDVRLRKQGYKILYTPETRVYHFKRSTLRSLWRQMYRYGKARARIANKHMDTLRFYHLLGPGFVIGCIIIALLSLFSIVSWVVPFGFIVLYLIVSLFSIIQKTEKAGIILCSPLIYFLIHFGYGSGFIRGIFNK